MLIDGQRSWFSGRDVGVSDGAFRALLTVLWWPAFWRFQPANDNRIGGIE